MQEHDGRAGARMRHVESDTVCRKRRVVNVIHESATSEAGEPSRLLQRAASVRCSPLQWRSPHSL